MRKHLRSQLLRREGSFWIMAGDVQSLFALLVAFELGLVWLILVNNTVGDGNDSLHRGRKGGRGKRDRDRETER